jgi:hypothetical protein
MANDAFALSPISARASMPTEADYEAICGAFMETARGRWFLGEYGKRNRNADTRMVLDAIARIEVTLASQKAAARPSLSELLPAITDLIADTQQRIVDTLPRTDTRPATEPIQRAAGILRDVAWTLRESGADTRVCDLLDVQAKAIVDGCTRMHGEQTSGPDAPTAVAAALDVLMRQVGALARADAPPPAPQAIVPASAEPPAEPPREEPSGVLGQPGVLPAVTLDVAPDESTAAARPTAEAAELAAPEAPHVTSEPQAAPEPTTPLTMVEVDVQASLREGLEVTDVEADEALTEPAAVAEPVAAEALPTIAEAKRAGPVAAIAAPLAPAPPPVVNDAPRTVPEPSTPEPLDAAPELPQKATPSSLGQAALDGGAVKAPLGRYTEALAPIRRMSQAEKVAFFS